MPSTTPSLLASVPVPLFSAKSVIPSLSESKSRKLAYPFPSVLVGTVFGEPLTPSLLSAEFKIPSPSVSAVPSTIPSLLASVPVPAGFSFKSVIPSLSESKSMKFGKASPSTLDTGEFGEPNKPSLESAESKIPSPSASDDPSMIPSLLESVPVELGFSAKSVIPSLSESRSK